MSDKKYAILGDIHGNLEALTTVLSDASDRGIKSFVCVGDVVGYNANPSECLDIIRDLSCSTVRGNHDHYCVFDENLDDFHPLAANVVDWTRKHLRKDQIEYLKNLKYSMVMSGFSVVHSTLDMPDKWGYVFDNLEADANFAYQTTSLCFHGHTHVPVIYEKQGRVTRSQPAKLKIQIGRKYFINVGSVGQPRDGDPRTCYATYDLQTKEIEFIRLPYDVETTQQKIHDAGLPERLSARLAVGK